MSLLWTLLTAAWGRTAAVGTALATVALAVLGAYRTVRRGGRQAQQLDDFKQAERDRAVAEQTANKALATVARMDDAAVDRELRARFSRGP